MQVIDLFCGAGGFSLGASNAGCAIILAVDSWEEALQVHRIHHPTANHWNMSLGGEVCLFAEKLALFTAPFMTKGPIHIHASPPCQNLSSSNVKRDINTGLRLVIWTLQLLEQLRIAWGLKFTYSIEQVPHPQVTALLTRMGLPWRKISFCNHGVPQTRCRVWASDASAAVNEMPQSYLDWRQLVEIPIDAIYITGSTICEKRLRERNSRFLSQKKSIASATHMYTLTSKIGNLFLDKDMAIVGRLTIQDYVSLQTFPPDYFSGVKDTSKAKMVANAIPPSFARAFMISLFAHKLSLCATVSHG